MLDEGIQAGVEGRHPPLCLDGRPFTALLRDDDQARDEALAALLSSLARPDVRVVRMGNSMRSRLMLEHVLIQATGPDGRTSLDGNTRQIARTIAERQNREAFVVLLITQAETLHSKTLRLLQAMRPYFAEAGAPTLQVVFVGRPAFRALLDERGMTPLQEALGFAARPDKPTRPAIAGVVAPAPEDVERRPLPAAPEVSEPSMPPDLELTPGTADGSVGHFYAAHMGTPAPSPDPGVSGAVLAQSPALPRRTLVRLSWAAGLAVLAFAAWLGLSRLFYRDVPASSALDLAIPGLAIPGLAVPAGPSGSKQSNLPNAAATGPLAAASSPTLPGEAAPPDAAAPPNLAAAPSGPRMDSSAPPDSSRNNGAAFPARSRPGIAEPAVRRSSEDVASSPAATSDPRVVIHVPAGSEGAEAMSAHLLATLGSRAGSVETRRVAGTPGRPSIRYFYPGDEAVAQRVAGWMAGAGLNWTLQDFSTFLPRPSRGTIEVWLPRS